MRVHGAGKPRKYSADGKSHYLVLLNIDADATRRHRILPDSQERTPHPGVYDPLLDDQEQRHHHDHEDKKPEVVVQFKAENADIRDPADTSHGVSKLRPGQHDVD